MAAFFLMSGCGSGAPDRARETKSAPAADCADKLPGTGLCRDQARSYLKFAGGKRPAPPEGCEWAVNETQVVDDYLLYLAAKCKGKITLLEYAGGARKAELTYAVSAWTGEASKGQKVVEIWSAEPGKPNQAILEHVRSFSASKAEAPKCYVRPAGFDLWPADALVVDSLSPAEAAKADKEGPRSACGPLGLDTDSQQYWRVFQGFSWFFDLGQDSAEIDPGSFTLVRKDDKGKWSPAPAE